MSGHLAVMNLTKTFPLTGKQRKLMPEAGAKIKALDKLSFNVGQGEVFGLLGPNGAGKTTTMRIIATLLKSDSGDVFVDGDSVKEYPFRIRRKIGFLSGDLKLEDFFTPAYLFDFFSSLRDVPKAQALKRREQLFERFGINEYAHKKFGALSSGMKQKVSFVVSITHDPKIIIFDEPTNGMDILAARTITEFLLELKKQGKTIILSTHIFSLAEKICDRVGFIINGKMLYSDSVRQTLDKRNLEEAFFLFYDQFRQLHAEAAE
ncbi:MAG: ABC transporter ATP-binding protein [Spirochaetes bacterium]|nr:ABC transporter ATP-binding protein [Spirochaetota bacterium]